MFIKLNSPVIDKPAVRPSETDQSFKTMLDNLTSTDTVKGEDPEQPPLFTVYLQNDDMSIPPVVVASLRAFGIVGPAANALMMQVHKSGPGGKAPVGTWVEDVAKTRIAEAKAIEDRTYNDMHYQDWPRALEFPMEKTAT